MNDSKRLDYLLNKENKTELEEIEFDRLLREYTKEHNIHYSNEYGWE